MKNSFISAVYICALAFGLPLPAAHADTGATASPAAQSLDRVSDVHATKDWTLEVGGGVSFSNVRDSNIDSQTAIPLQLTLAYAVDDVSLDEMMGGILRGYTDFMFRVSGGPITTGREDQFLGFEFGPRYNFVQPGWKLVPFVEATVGVWFVDSDPRRDAAGNQTGFGQDFNFMFSVASGARYDFTDEWFARAALVYTHVSNAGLSEPRWDNEAFDGLGPQLSLGYRF